MAPIPPDDKRPIQTVYVDYTIYFSQQSDYDFAVSVNGGSTNLAIPPLTAAATFGFVAGINYNRNDGTVSLDKGMYSIYYPFTVPGRQIVSPGDEGLNPQSTMDANVESVQVYTLFIHPVNYVYVWSATLQFANYQIAPVPSAVPTVGSRRWIMGFEFPGGGEGAGSASNLSRDSSRTPDGIGFNIRSSTNINVTRNLDQYQPGFTTHTSWERFYIRVRAFDSTKIDIWKCGGNPEGTSGVKVYINPDGTLAAYNVTAFSVETLLGTSTTPLELNTWYKLDLLPQYATTNGITDQGTFWLYINGTKEIDFNVPHASGGLGTMNFHSQSILGTVSASANVWEVDFDDWINAAIPMDPNDPTVISLTTPDWLAGTHIKRLFIDSASLGSFTGDAESMNQMINPPATLASCALVSNVSGDSMIGLASDGIEQDYTGTILYAISALVSKYGSRTGSANGSLGYTIAGGSPVMFSITEPTSPGFNTAIYAGTSTDGVPNDMFPLEVIYTKGAATNVSTVDGIGAVVEFCGSWGSEDAGVANERVSLVHNSSYPALADIVPSPIGGGLTANVGGTYTGTGTAQAILLPLPCHFLFIRPVVSGANVLWFGSAFGGHLGNNDGVIPSDIVRCVYDNTTNVAGFSVVGTNTQTNALGVVYQYIAFCDPLMQYNICGAYQHGTAVVNADNNLPISSFSPIAAFINFDVLGNSANARLMYKGVATTGSNANLIAGTNVTNVATLSSGVITSHTASHGGATATFFSAWRVGNNCDDCEVQITSYTGDGTGNRVITLTPESGRYPLFAYVQPHGAAGYYKDPSDAATSTSRQLGTGTTSTTAIITGGVDLLGVGSTLNALGVTYEVFVLPGDITGWNNGEFLGAFCVPDQPPVPPDPPQPPGTTTPPIVPVPPIAGISIFPNGGLELGETTPITLLKDVSGIYTIIQGKTNDTLYDRQTGQSSVDVKIPDPQFKTGYIGG